MCKFLKRPHGANFIKFLVSALMLLPVAYLCEDSLSYLNGIKLQQAMRFSLSGHFCMFLSCEPDSMGSFYKIKLLIGYIILYTCYGNLQMTNNGLAGFLGVQGCLRCQENEKKLQFSPFLKISVQFMATRGHILYYYTSLEYRKP